MYKFCNLLFYKFDNRQFPTIDIKRCQRSTKVDYFKIDIDHFYYILKYIMFSILICQKIFMLTIQKFHLYLLPLHFFSINSFTQTLTNYVLLLIDKKTLLGTTRDTLCYEPGDSIPTPSYSSHSPGKGRDDHFCLPGNSYYQRYLRQSHITTKLHFYLKSLTAKYTKK